MKSNYIFKLITLLIVLAFLPVNAQKTSDLWVKTDAFKAQRTEQVFRKISPIKEQFYQLNLEALKGQLVNIGNRETPGNTVISFPNSEGELNRYRVFEASVMEPELQAQYPKLRSYAGQGIDNPAETIRFSITTKGLHVMVLGTTRGAQFIDPFSADGNIYTVYAKRDLEASDIDFVCGVIDDEIVDDINLDNDIMSRNADDGFLRDYRIAIAATVEYTQYHGGTVAGAMAAMVTTMTRVNGVFERDLSITMTMVANSSIIFTSEPDGLSNDNANALIVQSQTVINAAIGAANYDIGHTFSTGGGGLATLNSTCSDTIKARGITGSPQPEGDPYDIDFVAHEIGHQFGAPHTFNGNQGNCAGGNRSAADAYEPGSGTTIMAYAGICGSDNVQNNSDAYFHQRSLVRIWTHVISTGACPVNRTATGNVEPTADAGANYTIPGGTPYKLDGSGSTDPDGLSTLTYTWEQYDLTPISGLPTETLTQGPLVRSFEGTNNPTRYVPRLSDILISGGVSTTWEKLATVDRSINYRLTVRDNDASGGQTDFDQMTITNVAAAGPFVVTSQTGNQIVWTPGNTETITWNVAGTTGNGINAANVNILLSTDEGLTYNTVLASNVPNDGSHDITVPNVSAPRCRIMVEGAGNIFFNINDEFFAIGNYVYENVEVCQDYLFNAGITIVENAASYTGYSLTIPDAVTISDLDINVNITGANNADIFHAIRGPFQAGGIQQLASGVCSGTANQDWTFDDEGVAINCGSTNNGDNVIPQVALSFADGQSSAGAWVFFITDVNVDGTTSVLNSVTITICSQQTVAVLSTEDNELEGLTIYPNPNNGEFNIGFNPRSGEDITVEVYDIRGRAIYTNTYNTVSRFEEVIRLNNAQSGVYLLSISDGQQKVTKKIIVD